MVETGTEAQEAQNLPRPLPCLRPRQAADELRHNDILKRRELRQKVMELVDEADLLAPQARALGVAHAGGRMSADIDLAAVRLLQQSRDMQEVRFAGAGGRDKRHKFARPD